MDAQVYRSIYRYKAQAAVLIPDRERIDTALEIAKLNNKARTQNTKILGMKLLGGDMLYSNETLSQGGNVEGLIVVVPWFREVLQI